MAGSEPGNSGTNQEMVDRMILLVSTLAFFLGLVMLMTGQAVTVVPLIIGFLGFAFVKIDSNQITNRIGATTDSSTEEQEALDVLRARYARGDIDQTEFESRLDDLLSTETVEQASEYRDEDLATEKS